MTSESATSPTIPQHSDHNPPNPINSAPISSSPPQATTSVVANSNGGAFDETDEEPSCFKYLDSKEYGDKYKKYESEFKQWVMSKHIYPNAVNLYEGRTVIDGETILSSKWPCTRFYADPCVSFSEEESLDSPSADIVTSGGVV